MKLDMNTSLSMALSFADPYNKPIPPLRTSSLRHQQLGSLPNSCSKLNVSSGAEPRGGISLYKGVSDRPLGWKFRGNPNLERSQSLTCATPKRWDGVSGSKTNWEGLRRDPELWFPEGNCLVHLYSKGQSKRGPSFNIPFEPLLEARCDPLLDRFLDRDLVHSPLFDAGRNGRSDIRSSRSERYELYIPAPPMAEGGQAMLHRISTRNFFAWLFGKPIVGPHLGEALVGLLKRMEEFRSTGVENVADILHFMKEEGYSNMGNRTDYALAVLYFAENFRLRDLWIQAFAHSVGMSEKLFGSSEYEYISRASRALISRSRVEMDIRLDNCGRSLGTFLEEELSASHLGLFPGARAHLDRFRSFLQLYYVAKLGYYPPYYIEYGGLAFPKDVYAMMRTEFEDLYTFLADNTLTSFNCISVLAQNGICTLENIRAFDKRCHYTPLRYPLPLLPEVAKESLSKTLLNWLNRIPNPLIFDRTSLDERLKAVLALTKASNMHRTELLECPLVEAYRAFERECVLSSRKTEKNNQISIIESRKVNWIVIYTMLQTLHVATEVPHEVRDTQDVTYSLCTPTTGCPPWTDKEQSDNSMLGKIPELGRPKPSRASYQEIIVHSYGNGLNNVYSNRDSILVSQNTEERQQNQELQLNQYAASPSSSTSDSQEWSNTNSDSEVTVSSPLSSVGSDSSFGDDLSNGFEKPMVSDGPDKGGDSKVWTHLGPKPPGISAMAGTVVEKKMSESPDISDSWSSFAKANPELEEYLCSGR